MLTGYTHIESRGVDTPVGVAGGVTYSGDKLRLEVGATDPKTYGGWRSQLVYPSLSNFGPAKIVLDFMVPIVWPMDVAIMGLHSVPDDTAESLVSRSGPFSGYIKGDQLRLSFRADANASTTANPLEQTFATATIVAGKWHHLEVAMWLSWLDGSASASLDGKCIGVFSGPTAYNDKTPTYPKLGPYVWGAPPTNPLVMYVSKFDVTQL